MSVASAPSKICAVTDEQTATGLRLAGLTEVRVATEKLAKKDLQELAADPEVAVIIVTEKIAEANHDVINRITQDAFPIIVEIPDRDGPITRLNDPIRELVLQAVGVDLG